MMRRTSGSSSADSWARWTDEHDRRHDLRIAQVLSNCPWGDVTPAAMNRGLGGRETALINLSEQWADMGHEVINFVPTEVVYHGHRDNGGVSSYVTVDMAPDYLKNLETDAIV